MPVKTMDTKTALGNEDGTATAPQASNAGGLPPNFQKQVDRFITNGMMVLHSPETRDNILEVLQANQNDKIVAAKQATLNTITAVESAASKQGKQINPMVVALAGPTIFGQVVEIGEASGLVVLTNDEKQVALAAGVQEYSQQAIKSGRISRQEMEQGARDLAQQNPDAVNSFEQSMGNYRQSLGGGQNQPRPQAGALSQQPVTQGGTI